MIYDLNAETLSIDRSQSGVLVSNVFKTPDSQTVTRNADGTVDLHIYVDRASVEVFANGFTVTGAEQIFPKADSQGVRVLVEGGEAMADIAVYPMGSIWNQNTSLENPDEIMSRGMMAELLYQLAGSPSSASSASAWVYAQNIMVGYGGAFQTDTALTWEQLAVALYRFAAYRGCDVNAAADIGAIQVSGWAVDAVRWAMGVGLLSKDGGFMPSDSVTRGKAAQVTEPFQQIICP